MRWLGALLHGLLLTAALVGAYFTWQSDDAAPARDAGNKQPIWEAGGDKSASAVEYRQGEKTTRVWLEGQGEQARPWVEVTEPAKKPKPLEPPKDKAKGKDKENHATKAKDSVKTEAVAPEAEAPLPPTATRFPGNAKTRDLLARLAAPMAERALGQAEPERLDQLGLAPPEASLEVTVAGKTRILEVGKVAYGTQGRYLRLPETGELFVAAADLVGDLKWAASRLKETDLLGPAAKDADHVVISSEGRTKQLVRLAADEDAPDKKNKKNKNKTTGWADAVRPDAEDEEATNWMQKLARLRARKHLAPGEQPAGAAVLTVRFLAGKAPADQQVLLRGGEEDKPKFLVQSAYLGGHAEVSSQLAEDLLQELGALFVSR